MSGMADASVPFILFGLLIALLTNLKRSAAWRYGVLLVSSVIFLGLLAHGWLSLLPLAAFLLLGYAGILMQRRGMSATQTWSVLAIVVVYAWLKKYTFLPQQSFLSFPYLALGLSYVFFRVLHLVIEAGSPGLAREIRPGAYLAYTLNFTTLVSGPIQRYDDFARQEFSDESAPLDSSIVWQQLERLLRGFFKVNVLALLLSMVHTDALLQLAQPHPTPVRLVAAFRMAAVYPFFLYANFSGYIDIVIALARLMRLRLPENFDRPFSSTSFLDFWNRWHITLSTWLKTYVYNPLLLSLMRRISSPAVQPFLGVVCFFVTFFLIGIWHGRTSEFALFGILQGGGVAANKLWQILMARRMGKKRYKALAASRPYVLFARGLTFTWFAFTLFWFWATWTQIHTVFGALGILRWTAVWAAVWLSASITLGAWEWIRERLLRISVAQQPVLTSRYARVVYATALALLAFIMTALLSQPAPDIVYKAF